MALYTIKEFSKKFNKPTNYLSVLVSRRKKGLKGLVLNEEGYFDDKNEHNALWISKQTESKTVEIEIETVEAEEVPQKEGKQKKKPAPDGNSVSELDKRKQIADVQKKEADLESVLLRNAKQKGEIIPVELIGPLMALNNQHLTTTFKNSAEELITSIAKSCDLPAEVVANANKTLVEVVNSAIKEATIMVENDLKVIIEDYKITVK